MQNMTTQNEITRRELLGTVGRGSGSLLTAGLLTELFNMDKRVKAADTVIGSHHAPRAKNVIFLYMSGGVSHVDSFDPKPQLTKDHGKTMVPDGDREFSGQTVYFQKAHWNFQRYGQCGMPVSELFPHIGSCADDICLIRSMRTSHINHYESALGIHTGSFSVTRPSIGSWLSYGLGTENQSLPAVVVLCPSLPYAGTQLWTADFLPAFHQGTRVIPGEEPVANLRPIDPADLQSLELQRLAAMNRRHLVQRHDDPAGLGARIKSFETAFRMQIAAPEVFDLAGESSATLDQYGLEPGSTQGFAWQCLVARRLVERGVRFVELIDSGSNRNWDSHGNMQDHVARAKDVDKPIAGLLRDLKARGLLEDTLVVWTTEFGRPPYDSSAQGKGRGHQHACFSSWLAGAGVKPGMIYGATDPHGLSVQDNEVHVHDFHATILHLMGLDHTRLTYRHAGRDFRLTDVAGNVIQPVLA